MSEPRIIPVEATIPSTDDAPATFAKAQALLDTLDIGARITNIHIRCDDCQTRGPAAPAFTDALAQAVALGWAHHPDGTDQCPNCKEQS